MALIIVCIKALDAIIEKAQLVKSNKDKATRLGKQCEGWRVILSELRDQKEELPKSAEVSITALNNALVRYVCRGTNARRRRSRFPGTSAHAPSCLPSPRASSLAPSDSHHACHFFEYMQIRADNLVEQCMKKKYFGSAAQAKEFAEVGTDIMNAMASLGSVCVTQNVEAKRLMESTSREVEDLRRFIERLTSPATPKAAQDGVIPFQDLYFDRQDSIGTGAQGQVFVGKWRTRDVAIKRLPNVGVNKTGADLLAFGSRELEKLRLAAQTCRNVVRVYGISHDDRNLYLVMQLLEQSLECLIDSAQSEDDGAPRVGLDTYTLLRLGEDMFRGLSDLHGLNPPMAHCDIKPANVLFDERGEAHLVDFGLAHTAINTQAGGSKIGASQGTFAYMSPESFDDGPANVERDVWAAAATLCHAASGVMPFASMSNAQVTKAVYLQGKTPDLVAGVFPEDVDKLLRLAFASEPAERPMASELMSAFGQAR